ncbi:hypothetical protein PHSY_006172 [Pseudozyma hubeiensis SY62]|uniref:Uncharacterized protein n=1 Tax=Pseudozyma hubeiensis (strain SY62) TaxID=1305764 RepID=R9PAZ6_PSEHS|nr:hypothetical protein PHSY_006172 [Pseudozyma hubeiensis SY62]GAC98578.1 hypothetical protein PHSY_006172 [Pseudozyma hubeiensis SY62]
MKSRCAKQDLSRTTPDVLRSRLTSFADFISPIFSPDSHDAISIGPQTRSRTVRFSAESQRLVREEHLKLSNCYRCSHELDTSPGKYSLDYWLRIPSSSHHLLLTFDRPARYTLSNHLALT